MSARTDGAPEAFSDRTIVTTRVLDAPRALVFKAWTDPDSLVRWWGPKGFTNTFEEFDPRPGGIWRFVMHGPDGVDYKNKSVFVEVMPPERIVFQHVSGPRFHVTATFAEQAGKTRLTFQMLFETAPLARRPISSASWTSSPSTSSTPPAPRWRRGRRGWPAGWRTPGT